MEDIRNYDLLFKDGKVIKDLQVVCYNKDDFWGDPVLVTLAGYSPYYTDGTPDPMPEDVDESCFIETNEFVNDECQIPLGFIYEIKKCDTKKVLYNGFLWDVIGFFVVDDEITYITQRDGRIGIKFIEQRDVETQKDIKELDNDSLTRLFNQVGFGSIYLADYQNTVGIPADSACDIFDGYNEWLSDRYGESCSEHDCADSFIEYINSI